MNIKSDIKGFTGTVTIYDRLVLSQVELVEAALLENRDTYVKAQEENRGARYTDVDRPKLPALFACVEKWEIKDFPEPLTLENFPLTPRRAANQFIELIFDGIREIYNGEQEVPKE